MDLGAFEFGRWLEGVRGSGSFCTTHGILTSHAIRAAQDLNLIEIEPLPPPECINPSSVDLHLGEEIRVYAKGVYDEKSHREADGRDIYPRDGAFLSALDVKKDNETLVYCRKLGEQFLLKPSVLYLMHTAERVMTTHFNPVLDGKSSLARLGISVHATAGYGEAGFNGQYTLEVTVTHPVWVYIGMRFCQIRFHTLCGPVELYRGHYSGETAKGAVPSRTWEQMNGEVSEGSRVSDPATNGEATTSEG
jgi:dCTP deaminase